MEILGLSSFVVMVCVAAGLGALLTMYRKR